MLHELLLALRGFHGDIFVNQENIVKVIGSCQLLGMAYSSIIIDSFYFSNLRLSVAFPLSTHLKKVF